MKLAFLAFLLLASCGRADVSEGDVVPSKIDSSTSNPKKTSETPKPTTALSGDQDVSGLLATIEAQKEIIRQKDIEIWYFLHASNRRSDFNDRFKKLLNNPQTPYMFLIETVYDQERVEYFVSGDETFARDVIANYEDTGAIEDVGRAVKLALANDNANRAKFYFSKWSGLKFKDECPENNPTLSDIYKHHQEIPANCLVNPDSSRYQSMKEALIHGTHYDLTKIFTDH